MLKENCQGSQPQRIYITKKVDILAPGGTWGGGGKNKLEQQTVMERRNTLTKYDIITKFHALGCSNMFSFPNSTHLKKDQLVKRVEPYTVTSTELGTQRGEKVGLNDLSRFQTPPCLPLSVAEVGESSGLLVQLVCDKIARVTSNAVSTY